MGLAERRAQRDFQNNRLPALQQQIDAAAGFEVPLEIEWINLVEAERENYYDEGWTKVFFEPLIAALQAVTVDDMGRDALKEGLKKVVFQNASENYSADRVASFADGVLTLDHKPLTNVDDIADRAKAIQRALEKGL